MKRKRILIIVGLVILAVLIPLLSIAFPPSFYLPHEIPEIILPFDEQYDAEAGIMPMGEKINHPDSPSGHPGVDYGWIFIPEYIPLIASMDGIVVKVEVTPNPEEGKNEFRLVTENFADVEIMNGPYLVRYGELDADLLPENIKLGAKVKQGDFIGYGNLMESVDQPGKYREMTHWEFRSISPLIDRFCPLEYFSEDSRERVEAIWEHTDSPEMKAQYPLICNGDYEGKFEK